jgi:hypothetical protein
VTIGSEIQDDLSTQLLSIEIKEDVRLPHHEHLSFFFFLIQNTAVGIFLTLFFFFFSKAGARTDERRE